MGISFASDAPAMPSMRPAGSRSFVDGLTAVNAANDQLLGSLAATTIPARSQKKVHELYGKLKAQGGDTATGGIDWGGAIGEVGKLAGSFLGSLNRGGGSNTAGLFSSSLPQLVDYKPTITSGW